MACFLVNSSDIVIENGRETIDLERWLSQNDVADVFEQLVPALMDIPPLEYLALLYVLHGHHETQLFELPLLIVLFPYLL